MNWKYTSQELPPDDDTLYWAAWVNKSTKKTKLGKSYLTGSQILAGHKPFWIHKWEVYAYSPAETITAPPLNTLT